MTTQDVIFATDLDETPATLAIADQTVDRGQAIQRYVSAGLATDVAERLEGHAERIVQIRQQSIQAIGAELLAARQEAKHGTWGLFLERIGIAETTARHYMDVAERFGNAPPTISATVANLPPGVQYTLAAPKADPVAVGEIIAEVAAGAPVPTVKDVRERVTPPAPAKAPAAPKPVAAATPTPVAAATPPVVLTPVPAPTVAAGFDLQQRKLLVAKQQLLAAALDLVEQDLATANDGPTIVISGDRARDAARSFISNPALASAAALLALSATVEEAAT